MSNQIIDPIHRYIKLGTKAGMLSNLGLGTRLTEKEL